MARNLPDGFRILSSPSYEWVLRNSITAGDLTDLCTRLNLLIGSFGYQVEDWNTNPIFIMNPGGWVLPTDQKYIHDWMLSQVGCKYVRTVRDKNSRTEAMHLSILDESKKPIALR